MITITGATGTIGSELVGLLSARGVGKFFARRDALAIILTLVLWLTGLALRPDYWWNLSNTFAILLNYTELALIAIAHRGVFVHQSSQASASHLIAGVLKGLTRRRPAIFNLYTPCPVEHGLADDWAQQAARLALESRAFPYLTYDPDAGPAFADCLSLEGNPSPDALWPTYPLKYLDEAATERTLELPLTIADWAATETRFKQHFKELPATGPDEAPLLFSEYLAASPETREGRTPFIYAAGKDRRLRRLGVSQEMVRLAEERLHFWHQLRQLAQSGAGDSAALEQARQAEYAAFKAEYPRKRAR